jgi:hypothetical protein
MATTRDWDKHRYLKFKGERLKDLPLGGNQNQFYKDNNLWHLKGKYYGLHINKLPLTYLNWIINNFNNEFRQLAETELYRRYHQLTPKVGGPDSNTAVQNPA